MEGRPRANTFLGWRRPRTDHTASSSSSTATTQSPPLSLDALIDALTPPAVPSLSHARALASSIASASPLPRRATLIPVLASLCQTDAPVAIQAAGYDVLSAYFEHNEAPALGTDDRLAYFSLFLGSSAWATDLWEPRFKALRALTKLGRDVVGIELDFIRVLQSWIATVFDGLLKGEPDHAERERSIDVLSKFLSGVINDPNTIARIPEADIAAILDFYAGFVDRAVLTLPKPKPPVPTKSSHRKHTSSLSSNASSIISSPIKLPADIAISLYLDHFHSQRKILSPDYLPVIIPLLLRALAFTCTPLPRLSIHPHPAKKHSSEEKLTEALNVLFSGSYPTRCMFILKQHLFPPQDLKTFPSFQAAVYTSLGAHRTFRVYVRRALRTRLARSYINRESSLGYSASGAPAHLNLERDLMEKAWGPSEESTMSALGLGRNGWDAGRLGRVLTRSVGAWVAYPLDGIEDQVSARIGKEDVLEEAAAVPYDIWQEMDTRGEDEDKGGLDEEEAFVIGETLEQLAEYVVHLKNPDGTPYILTLGLDSSTKAPTPLLRRVCNLLSRDHAYPTSPLLSTILIRISDNLTDLDTANLPRVMSEQHDLSPTSPEWLKNWANLLANRSFVNSSSRPMTRRAVMEVLGSVYDSVKDMKAYRVPLADLVLRFCRTALEEGVDRDSGDVTWRILGDEVGLRSGECKDEDPAGAINSFLDLLVAAASEEDIDPQEEEEAADTASVAPTETHPASLHSPTPPTQPASPSPNLSRSQSEHPSVEGERERSGSGGIMGIISSLTTGHSSRLQSSAASSQLMDDVSEEPTSPPPPPPPLLPLPPRAVAATSALVSIFGQLAFTPLALQPSAAALAMRIYTIILSLANAKSSRVRLTAVQFLLHMRADRDHRLYFTHECPSHVMMLATLIHRTHTGTQPPSASADGTPIERGAERDPSSPSETRKPRPLVPLREQEGRALSRGRAGTTRPSRTTTASRSQSRVRGPTILPKSLPAKPQPPLWRIPETYLFEVTDVTPSESLVSYDPNDPRVRPVLPVSQYLAVIIGILEKETSWDVLSYVLCHLPVQLANKHLFCGPKARAAISKMLNVLCTAMLSGDFGIHVEDPSVKPRDAQGLAFHTLSVLVSYRRCFELKQCHVLVEVFQMGLTAGQFSTTKCCLHALSLSAVELQPSMTKALPRILESLSQIMSGANMAVHILGFLFLIGAIPPLYVNFTESDYRMVFGVALQYLQHYNRIDVAEDPNTSWALSQHVRILSYTIVYVWFLALKLPDRPKHVPYITRQLLIANEENDRIDDPTEVCFDWLARYTYASADPRPAPSVFNDLLMNPPEAKTRPAVVAEKSWLYGYSLITIRTLVKRGWIEVLCRRPSGFTKFMCHVENTPLVGAGDVDPDLFTVPATLMMERNPGKTKSTDRQEAASEFVPDALEAEVRDVFEEPEDENTPHPNPVTGYVWSGTAPSQRRKDVSIDPSFFALQLSAYPNRPNTTILRGIHDPAIVKRFTNNLDLTPVIDTHKVGILYVAPGQTEESEILRNTHGSPAYTRFLEGLGRLINLRDQLDVYAGGLDADEDGEYAYAWWDDIGQVLYHTATMMPNVAHDPACTQKKRHIGNDYVRIVWNDSGHPYKFDTLATQFQFVNIVIEPHSLGAIAAFSNNLHENEYFKVTVQRAPRMTEFAPVGHFKLISAEALPLFIRQLSRLADWFASVFSHTQSDTAPVEMKTNWRTRLESIRRFKNQLPPLPEVAPDAQNLEVARDFTPIF
ncbi:hypothetical protein H0H92_001839 [Tricholoma furcatifolium]|nr:hypothetical protein H0H92_001839 [Tricholoma furcatifolium]